MSTYSDVYSDLYGHTGTAPDPAVLVLSAVAAGVQIQHLGEAEDLLGTWSKTVNLAGRVS